jgi:hypothetical protein
MKASITSTAIGAIILTGAIPAQGQSFSADVQSITETEGLPRLPSFFKNCEEPLPRYCVRPPGLLWFGSIATIEQERTAGYPAKHRSKVPSNHANQEGVGTQIRRYTDTDSNSSR